jgi:uncharacterized protein with von Willebrand factor type A (vWA) domain
MAAAQSSYAVTAAMEAKALEEKKRVEIGRLREKKSTLDLCFVMDCTGSMGASIKACADKICEVVDTVKQEFQGLTAFNIAFVGYRDYGDTPQHEVG